MRRWRSRDLVVLTVAGLLTGGCAERQLVSSPGSAPGAGTWSVVWVAGGLAAVVVGLLLTLPAWELRGGARFAVALLTLQTGAVVVAGTLLAAIAYRSWQLIDRPADAPPVSALLRLSRLDGDTSFLALMVLVTVLVTALLATLTSLAARFAAGTDPVERAVASALLTLELAGSAFAIVRLAVGDRGWAVVAGALAFPIVAAALATCWPRARYNRAHG